MELSFLGAAGTVTGSKYLISHQNHRFMLDCGLYQGIKNLRERNWKSLPVSPKDIKCLLLTHAHLDHSGYIPALVKHGFRGKIFCTHATKSLARVLLPDSGFLQEEDARYANKRHFSKHSPALPLYTEKEAWKALEYFEPVDFHDDVNFLPGFKAQFIPAGHILGASSISIDGPAGKMVFSGDLGRPNDLIMRAPEAISQADYLILESTYGDRLHESVDIPQLLADIVNSTAEQGGIVLIPAFAVGRAQALLHLIQELKNTDRIPDLPVYLNSPMAISATEIFCHYHHLHRLTPEQCHAIDQGTQYVRTVEESIDLNQRKFPSIIVSASGMASGGRVLHHLKALLSDHRNSVVFAGFQAPGTRGDSLVNGAQQIKIHGQYYPVRASIYQLDALSAHADYDEILSWLENFTAPPKHTFITHGEPLASDALRLCIKDRLNWSVSVPEYQDKVTFPM
ncbi:MBL fold metallo-hydrolase RNA specificity domain-containing protein [Hahella ganghwensis]|uniref:MBL fold metallo-hydrolase RNA specificity domain-containing protein n=1 Tax=Hahella ganghwensis TaxID=286420 RepID=UPI00037F06F6|nr:MBL fold metallo-hydrolase [Hahella ganghwensis]